MKEAIGPPVEIVCWVSEDVFHWKTHVLKPTAKKRKSKSKSKKEER